VSASAATDLSPSALTQRMPAYPITSVDNALRLLLLFRERQVLRLSAISQELRVAPSTAHRLLAMLQYHGFVRQDSTNRAYIAGPALIEARVGSPPDDDLRRTVRPYLELLMDTTGETAHLMIRVGREAMFVDAVESDAPAHVASRVGIVAPAHDTSGGRALLARLPDAQVCGLYEPHAGAGDVEAPAEVDALLRDLRDIRARGYATSPDGTESNIVGVARAFALPDGAAGALVVSAPAKRLGEAALSDVVAQLQRMTGALAADS
jgi:IclR family acetate operon transcriptional repressor